MKIGRFRLGKDHLRTEYGRSLARDVMDGLLVVRAEYRWDMDAIEYMAIGEQFDDLPDGAEALPYTPQFEWRDTNEHEHAFGIDVPMQRQVFTGWRKG
jgi:hypothetical protein